MFKGDLVVVTDHDTAANVVREICLSGPETHPLSVGVLGSIGAAVDSAVADARVLAVVLSHDGACLSAGSDVAQVMSAPSPRKAAKALLEALAELLVKLQTAPVLSIAALDGVAAGAGAEMMLACDVRIFGRDSWIHMPEVSSGLIPGFLAGGVLQSLRGWPRAREFALLGDRWTGEECVAAGLGQRVTNTSARAAALARAARLKPQGRLGIARTKQLFGGGQLLACNAERAVQAMLQTVPISHDA